MVGDSAGSCAGTSPATALARPKSRILTVSSGVIRMFAGLRSRWTIPRSCAASSASAICRAIGCASLQARGPRATRAARSSPSTSSMTMRDVALGLLDAVDLGDVRMIQRGEGPCFTLEARATIRVVSEDRRQNLDGDLAVELDIARAMYLAHPACADQADDLVWPEAGRPPPSAWMENSTPRAAAGVWVR